MSGSSIFFLILSALTSLVGLATASASVELGLTIFGHGLFLFGLGFAISVIKRHFDAAEAVLRSSR
jgi:hypothetical protein